MLGLMGLAWRTRCLTMAPQLLMQHSKLKQLLHDVVAAPLYPINPSEQTWYHSRTIL